MYYKDSTFKPQTNIYQYYIIGEINYLDWFICTMLSVCKYIWFQDCLLDS